MGIFAWRSRRAHNHANSSLGVSDTYISVIWRSCVSNSVMALLRSRRHGYTGDVPLGIAPRRQVLLVPSSEAMAATNHQLKGSFASLEERVAHLQWRKTCNERQIQGTLRLTKQLQERDEFRRIAKQGGSKQEKVEWMQRVIHDELAKPLPVTPQYLDQLLHQELELEKSREDAATRHMSQIQQLTTKLDDRWDQLARKKEFEKKKKELFQGSP